jgi:predicted nucleic acid-binding protein
MASERLMSTCFLDTNVIFYAASRGLSPRDSHKRPPARDLIGKGDFSLSAQVLAEFYDNVTRKGPAPFTHDEAVEFIDLLRVRPCVPVDAELVVEGAKLCNRYQLSYWDGAIVAAAHIAGAMTLYTEDLNDGQRYGDVVAINPFKQPTH